MSLYGFGTYTQFVHNESDVMLLQESRSCSIITLGQRFRTGVFLLVKIPFIHTIRDQLPEWDIDAFLPPGTLTWCQDFLRSIGYNSSDVQLSEESRMTPLLSFYLKLRTALQEHISSNADPQLSLLPTPVGVSQWQQNNREEFIRSVDLETDLLDPNQE
jgi:hypothetical protein